MFLSAQAISFEVECSVKTKLGIMIIFLVLSTLLMAAYAQSSGQYQSVGGDFGRTWLNDFKTQNPTPAKNDSSNSLWNWGGAPKGRSVINGQLMNDPYYYWKSLNLTYGWLGQAYVDKNTGYPVFAFIDPYTGRPDYFYMDPKSGGPVFVNPNSPSGSDSGSTANNVPSWIYNRYGYPYSSAYSWLGMPDMSDASNIYDYYGYGGTGTASYYSYGSGGGSDYGGTGLGSY